VWSNHVPVPGTPEGFTARTTYPTNPDGVEVMLERWHADTEEPPHFHPGDDMTVVVEGKMAVQFYRQEGRVLFPDGERIVLNKGDVATSAQPNPRRQIHRSASSCMCTTGPCIPSRGCQGRVSSLGFSRSPGSEHEPQSLLRADWDASEPGRRAIASTVAAESAWLMGGREPRSEARATGRGETDASNATSRASVKR